MEFKTKGDTVRREPVTQTVKEIRDNNKYIANARTQGREHVFIHELPYSSRFVKSRSKHDFLDVHLGAIYI